MLERMWPIWVEKVCSQEIIPALAPWFFDKYKPWHVVSVLPLVIRGLPGGNVAYNEGFILVQKKAVLQKLFLGTTPPLITTARIVPTVGFEDHVVRRKCHLACRLLPIMGLL